MRWLPSLRTMGASLCERDGEAEGVMLQLRWGRFVIELTFAAFDRSEADGR